VLSEKSRQRLERAVKDFQNGDRRAFDVIFTLTKDAVFRICRHIVGSYHEAEDVMQEVFMKVYTSLDSFRGEAAFSTWLYTVARNRSLNHVKKRGRREEVVQVVPDCGEGVSDGETAGEGEESGRAYDLEVLRSCIRELPPACRTVVVLRDIEGLSYEEIARVEGIPVGTVRSRLSRGRRMLQELFFRRR